MSDITCDHCGNIINCADALDAGWILSYYRDGILIEAPVCDRCRLSGMEYTEDAWVTKRAEFI